MGDVILPVEQFVRSSPSHRDSGTSGTEYRPVGPMNPTERAKLKPLWGIAASQHVLAVFDLTELELQVGDYRPQPAQHEYHQE